jgi:hypothetical protein
MKRSDINFKHILYPMSSNPMHPCGVYLSVYLESLLALSSFIWSPLDFGQQNRAPDLPTWCKIMFKFSRTQLETQQNSPAK